MPIPENIEREHIFQAMLKIEFEGARARRGPKDLAVRYQNKIYPCKLLISWANIFINHEELDLDSSNFNTYNTQEYLINKGFETIHV